MKTFFYIVKIFSNAIAMSFIDRTIPYKKLIYYQTAQYIMLDIMLF